MSSYLSRALASTRRPSLINSVSRLINTTTHQPENNSKQPHQVTQTKEKISDEGVKPNNNEPKEEGDELDLNKETGEIGGPRGPEPTRYGDWEKNGRCSDF